MDSCTGAGKRTRKKPVSGESVPRIVRVERPIQERISGWIEEARVTASERFQLALEQFSQQAVEAGQQDELAEERQQPGDLVVAVARGRSREARSDSRGAAGARDRSRGALFWDRSQAVYNRTAGAAGAAGAGSSPIRRAVPTRSRSSNPEYEDKRRNAVRAVRHKQMDRFKPY